MVTEGREDAPGEGDVPGLDLDPGDPGEGLDDGEQGPGGEGGRLVREGVDDRRVGHRGEATHGADACARGSVA